MAKGASEKAIRNTVSSMLSKELSAGRRHWGEGLGLLGLALGFGTLLYTVLNPNPTFVIGLALAFGCIVCLAGAICVVVRWRTWIKAAVGCMIVFGGMITYWTLTPRIRPDLLSVLLRMEQELLDLAARLKNSQSIPSRGETSPPSTSPSAARSHLEVTGINVDFGVHHRPEPTIQVHYRNDGPFPVAFDDAYECAALVPIKEDGSILPITRVDQEKAVSDCTSQSHWNSNNPQKGTLIGVGRDQFISLNVQNIMVYEESFMINGTKWLYITGKIQFKDDSGLHGIDYCFFKIPNDWLRMLDEPPMFDPNNITKSYWGHWRRCEVHNGQW